jgi:hypothetical protein
LTEGLGVWLNATTFMPNRSVVFLLADDATDIEGRAPSVEPRLFAGHKRCDGRRRTDSPRKPMPTARRVLMLRPFGMARPALQRLEVALRFMTCAKRLTFDLSGMP